MVRLFFLLGCALYIWIQSQFVHTTHIVAGENHIFAYSWLGIGLGLGFNVVPLVTAWYLWRYKKDKIGAAIFLLCIPMVGILIMPQLFLERVEVTSIELHHRREPPHSRYNATVRFDEIDSAIELVYEKGTKGYSLRLKDGTRVELPANTVLTAASDTIDAQLANHNIPVKKQSIPLGRR
jgi:hypothetical protein